MELKLGVMAALSGAGAADPATTARFVSLLEELGCESVWAVEHVVMPGDYASRYPYDPAGRMGLAATDDVPDPLHWLTFAAAHTQTLRLGTAMLILPEHQPATLAKRLATLDVLSGGRLLAGIGVGWLREEYDALGVPFEHRGARADEYLEAMRALWTGDAATYHGRYVTFDNVHSRPRPVRGTVPIVVGGHSVASVRRAARYGAGWYPLGVRGDEFAGLLDRLRAECETLGRDPAEVEVTMRAPGNRAELETLRSLGVGRVVIRADPRDPVDVRDKIRWYQREVLKA
ncbi:LLM class F420-dependent oxidoreductase [Dactylosporangium sp. NPDC005572]|uniref:LLM class F420-dependent oxidoreductase n=1 Tax=Dactylosporangium sp. NPDC005572 TaxID=3156889 RepID=UPI0033AF21A0